MHQSENGTCVYDPSLAPVEWAGEKITGVAAGATTCLHELAMLISLTVQPCMRWQELGFGQASVLYRRTQIMLEAARLLPAHRRLPHVTSMFSCYGSFGCLLSGSMYSRKNCPPESAFHFWNGGSRIRCSHGGNLHAVNRPLRGASVNLGCFFLRPGTHGSKLTPLPGLCQPWLFFFGRRSGGRIWS